MPIFPILIESETTLIKCCNIWITEKMESFGVLSKRSVLQITSEQFGFFIAGTDYI